MNTKRGYSSCQILRTKTIREGTLDVTTANISMIHFAVVTEPCNAPLFGEKNQLHGVCDSCRRGWEVGENTFANRDEKLKAMQCP